MKPLTILLTSLALSVFAEDAKPAAAAPAATTPVVAPAADASKPADQKNYAQVWTANNAAEFAAFQRNVQAISQEVESLKMSKQLLDLALTTPEREARSHEIAAKQAKLQGDDDALAKAYGFRIQRQYIVVPTKLNVLLPLSNEEYTKVSSAAGFKPESVVVDGEKKYSIKDTITGAVEVETYQLQVKRVIESKRALQQLIDLQPRLTKEEDKKKVETAVKSAQEEVNKALEEYKAARSYEFPAEFSIQTAGANLLLQISDEEKKALDKSQSEKKEEKPAEKK